MKTEYKVKDTSNNTCLLRSFSLSVCLTLLCVVKQIDFGWKVSKDKDVKQMLVPFQMHSFFNITVTRSQSVSSTRIMYIYFDTTTCQLNATHRRMAMACSVKENNVQKKSVKLKTEVNSRGTQHWKSWKHSCHSCCPNWMISFWTLLEDDYLYIKLVN